MVPESEAVDSFVVEGCSRLRTLTMTSSFPILSRVLSIGIGFRFLSMSIEYFIEI